MERTKGKIKESLAQDYFLKKAKEEGFQNIEDFVKANLHYLPQHRQELFHSIASIEKTGYQKKPYEKTTMAKANISFRVHHWHYKS